MVDITKAAASHPGHLGVNIFRPSASSKFYRVVVKFDTMQNYLAWENSTQREELLKRFEELNAGEQETEILSGLETWFTLEGEDAVVPPPRYKMMIVIWFAIFPLSLALNLTIGPFLRDWPAAARVGLLSILMVGLMTYFLMPLMTRIFHRWLHKT